MMTGATMTRKIDCGIQSTAKGTLGISIVNSKNGKPIRLTDERWTDKLKDTASRV